MLKLIRSAVAVIAMVFLTASVTAFTPSTSSPAPSDSSSSSDSNASSCPEDPNLTSTAPLDRSQLDTVSSKVKELVEMSPDISPAARNDFEVSGGSTRSYADGHSITTAVTYIGGKPAVFSSLTTPGSTSPQYVSLLEAPDPSNPDNDPKDLLADTSLNEATAPAGYYAKTCADYSGSCLKKLVKSGCDAGACGFLFWNSYAFGSCLAGVCFVGSQKCCTRWIDTWHEY